MQPTEISLKYHYLQHLEIGYKINKNALSRKKTTKGCTFYENN